MISRSKLRNLKPGSSCVLDGKNYIVVEDVGATETLGFPGNVILVGSQDGEFRMEPGSTEMKTGSFWQSNTWFRSGGETL